MLLAHDLGFLFAHAPKTGGTSMSEALRVVTMSHLPFVHKRHQPAADLKIMMGDRRWESFYKFGFVRNPWDWTVSLYTFLMNEPWQLWLDKKWRDPKTRNPRKDLFKKFREGDLGLFVREFDWTHFTPTPGKTLAQTSTLDWFEIDGKLAFDQVYMFEYLQDHAQHISSVIGREITVPHRRKTEHRDYRTYYDDDTAELVAGLNTKLISEFGYTFDEI